MTGAMLYVILFVCIASFAFNRKIVAYSVSGLIEDGLDTEHAGVIASSQNAAFSLSKFAAGLLSDRIEPRLLFGGGLLASALATLAFSTASAPGHLAVIWFLNGLAQGCSWPATAKILRQRASPSQFGTLWSILASGNNVSGSLGPIVSAFIIVHYGWRWNVFFAGSVTLVLCLVFALSLPFLSDTPSAQVEKASSSARDRTDQGGALSALFRDPFVWMLSTCFMVTFCTRTTVIDWGQLYLMEEKGHNQYVASAFTSSVEVGGFVGRIAAGIWTDRLVKRVANSKVPSEGGKSGSRLSVAVLFLIGSVLSVGLFRFQISETSSFVWITCVGALMGSCFYGTIAILGIVSSESVPPHLSGSSHAIVALFGNVGATLSGLPFSYVAKRYKWSTVFLLLEVLVLGSMLLLLRCRKRTARVATTPDRLKGI